MHAGDLVQGLLQTSLVVLERDEAKIEEIANLRPIVVFVCTKKKVLDLKTICSEFKLPFFNALGFSEMSAAYSIIKVHKKGVIVT